MNEETVSRFRRKRPWRRLVQAASALLAAALALRLIPLETAPRLFPALSPLLAAAPVLALQALSLAALAGLPVVLLALWRRRWFCFHLCPTGFCLEYAGRLHPRAAALFGRWPPIGRILVPVLFASAAAGWPLFLWLDPLALFNGFFSAWRRPLALAAFGPAVGFAVLLLLSVWRPHLWCLRLCPLGALQDLLHAFRRWWTDTRQAADTPPAVSRRAFISLLAGGLAAWSVRRLAPHARAPLPIRPPGAAPERAFAALCARCGACLRACPARILKPDTAPARLPGLLAPVVRYEEADYCRETCRACTLVCPSGALRPLDLADKQQLAIGTAGVNRHTCVAWSEDAYCLLCLQACPYGAIDEVDHAGTPCPVVDPARCRGCGACQNACPVRPARAIAVRGGPQRVLEA